MVYCVGGSLLIMLRILVALARMASRRGFGIRPFTYRDDRRFQEWVHGKLGANLLRHLESDTERNTIGWYLSMIALVLVVAWALKRGDAVGPIPKRGLAALFGAAMCFIDCAVCPAY